MYLELSDYNNFGGKLDKTDFERFRYRAEKIIDTYTASRLKNKANSDIPEDVKRCMYELTEYISSNISDGDIRSVNCESNDGVSVSYDTKASEAAIYNIVYTYLSESGLMYRGVNL